MNFQRFVAASIATAVLASPCAQAQRHVGFDTGKTPPLINQEIIPKKAGSPEAFVPADWSAHQSASNESETLIAQAICPKEALRQIEHERKFNDCGACVGTLFHCALLVTGRQGLGWKRVDIATDVLPTYENQLSMTFKGDVLVTEVVSHGHYSSSTETRKYRYEPTRRKMRLIGRDIESAGSTGFSEYVERRSENWLTRKSKNRTCEPIKSNSGCSSWKHTKLETKKRMIFLDDGWDFFSAMHATHRCIKMLK